MPVPIQLRRGDAAKWTSVNPILADGEMGYEKDTRKSKVGNGLSHWASLPYHVSPAAGTASVTSAEAVSLSAALRSAIDVVGNGLSDLVSAHNALSNRVSVNSAAGGAGSVTSNEASAIAAQAASAIDVVSNAVSNEVSNRVSADAALSAAITIVSNAASTADLHASTASAAATSADAHANTVSARVVSVSAELASLVQIASAAATSADGHANTVSARVVSVSAELASLVQIASAAATSVNARATSLANQVSAITFLNLTNDGASTAEVGMPVYLAASAASTFALANASVAASKNVVGLATTQIVVTDIGNIQTRGVLALTTGEWDAITGQSGGLTIGSKYYLGVSNGSLTVTPPTTGFVRPIGIAIDVDKMLIMHSMVDDWVPFISAVSARSVGNVSTHGFQSVVNALSNRISAVVAGAASVTSNELSTASAQAASAINVVSARVVSVSAELASLVQIASAAATSADGHANTVSARVVSVSAELASLVQIASAAATSADNHANTVSARVVSVSAELASLVQIASAAATSADGHANTASAAATSANARVNSVLVFISGISSRSVGGVSTHGFQSVIDALSNRISAGGGGGSVTSTELSAASAQAASAISVLNDVVSNLSQVVSTLEVRVSDIISLVSAASALSVGGAATAGLQGALNALSNTISNEASARAAISANVTSLQSTVSHLASIVSLVSAVSGGGTAVGLQSVINALSNRISAIPGAGSANPRARVISAAVTVSNTALANIAGFTLSVSAGGVYQLEAMILANNSSAGQHCNIGISFPTMNRARGTAQWHNRNAPQFTSATISNYPHAVMWNGNSASGSVLVSTLSGQLVSMLAEIKGVFDVNTGGVVQIQTGASASAGSQVVILPGSFLKLHKLN